jgi:signal transduction histidine kinase
MTGRWRVSSLHLVAFAAGLTTVLGMVVYGTIERVNQISLASAQTVLVAADAVAAAVAFDARTGDWPAVQEQVRAMATPHMRVRYRVVAADGTVLADSQQIRASGRLDLPLAAAALAQGKALNAAGARPTELVAAEPLPNPSTGGAPAAVLVVNASWERQYLELRTAIEQQALFAALLLLTLVTSAFVAVWRLGAEPLHRLRAFAEATAAGDAETPPPAFRLADLHAIGQALSRLRDRAAVGHQSAEHQQSRQAELMARNRELEARVAALEAEAEVLENARETAEAANYAKSEFLARMSHDLRTPLHGIIGFAEMIRDQMVGPIGREKYVDYAQDIHQSGVHLLRLINDVLDLSKIEAGRFELASDCIAVAVVIRESIHVVSPLARQRQLTLTTTIDPDLPPLTGDERTLRQMMFNLLSNAIKFTDPGGCVTVTARRIGGGLDITVADNGMGIEAEDLDVVFTEFGQAAGQAGNPRARPAEGTGLGLVIVKSLIELHGGRITLQSEPGDGTAVTLSFPPERLGARPH